MTPTQLRAYAAVTRHGSVKRAASELGVTESAVSLLVGQLRRELGDPLFSRTSAGLAFTPGGLRLASRAPELLGLQDRTIHEVTQARHGRRLLRLATSSLFAEFAAPGLIELFTGRANDLDVEMQVHPPGELPGVLAARGADLAIGPRLATRAGSVIEAPFLNYQVVAVTGPGHPLVGTDPRPSQLREQTWLLGPSAASAGSATHAMLASLGVPESHQRIFQSHAAAFEATAHDAGVSVALAFAVAGDLAQGRLVQLHAAGLQADAVWCTMTLSGHDVVPAAAELARFVTTPRATQAMLRGAGVGVGRFRPSVHITLWS